MDRDPLDIAIPRQKGVVLFTALILLLVLTLSGVLLARMQMGEQRMVTNDSNHAIAIEASEAALRAAEAGLRSGAAGFTNFSANTAGLYTLDPAVGNVYPTINWKSPGVTTLAYTGPALDPHLVQAPPQVVIEELPAVAMPGANTGMQGYGSNTPPVQVYRITSNGVGADATANATLQSVVH